MKIGAPTRILIVAGVAAAALIGLVISEGMARDSGTEVLLPIEAVDPRALLEGHYVIVAPTLRLEAGEHCPPSEGEQKWVALAPRGSIHVVVGGAGSREQAQLMGPVVARGEFTCDPPLDASGDIPAQPGWVRVMLGADRFHINQREAERIDRVIRAQKPDEPARAFVAMSIGADGRARIKGLVVDDQRLDLTWY